MYLIYNSKNKIGYLKYPSFSRSLENMNDQFLKSKLIISKGKKIKNNTSFLLFL
jgi:hypothetical protein